MSHIFRSPYIIIIFEWISVFIFLTCTLKKSFTMVILHMDFLIHSPPCNCPLNYWYKIDFHFNTTIGTFREWNNCGKWTTLSCNYPLIKVPSNAQMEVHNHFILKIKSLHLLKLLKHQKQELKIHFPIHVLSVMVYQPPTSST
jgi:hypothetical protein